MEARKFTTSSEVLHYDFQGVRFTPAVLHFKDVYEDPVVLTFTVQNLKNVPVMIVMQEPSSMGFKILSETREMKLCPGMRLSRNVKYRGIKDSVLESSVAVFVDGVPWRYPIKVSKAEGHVKVEPPEVNFGTVDVGQSVVIRSLTLNNEGALANKFAFDLGNNNLDLVVRPLRGIIFERSSVNVTFEFVALKPGYLRSECWLRLFPEMIRIPITVMVYMPRLDVRHPNSVDDFTLLEFPPTFCNTECSQSAIIHNMSAGHTSFVILAEVNSELMPIRKARNIRSEFKMFSVNPSEGRMESFEGRLCTVTFQPKVEHDVKGWKHDIAGNFSEDYLAFLRLIRVQCLDKVELENVIRSCEKEDSDSFIMDDTGLITTFDVTSLPQRGIGTAHSVCLSAAGQNNVADGQMTVKSEEIDYPKVENTVRRLCLHGTAILPELTVEPWDLTLGSVPVGETRKRILSLHNRCPYLPLRFQHMQLTGVRVEPSSASIGPQEKLEVLVIIRPTCIGTVKKQKIVFALYGKIGDGSLREIGKKSVTVSWEGVHKKKVTQPRFNMGITPQMTNEVGIFTDDVTFGTPVEKPRAAVHRADLSKKRYWFPPFPLPKTKAPENGDSFAKMNKLIRTEAQYLEKLSQVSSDTTGEETDSEESRINEDRSKQLRATRYCESTSCSIRSRPSGIKSPVKQASKSVKYPSVAGDTSLLSIELNQSIESSNLVVKDLLRLTIDRIGKDEKPNPWDDLIAFPNDRPRSLRPWPKDKKIRTIFTGKTRYSAPQDSRYNFSEETQRTRTIAAERQLNYLREYARKKSLETWPASLPEYEGRNEGFLCKLLQVPPPPREDEILDSTNPRDEYVPLTPMQVYNVKIEPRTINFGKVTPGSVSYEMLHIENHNSFAVTVRLIPGTRGVALPDGDIRMIKGPGCCDVRTSFTAATLGRYNGFLVYVINSYHTFEVTMTAEVVAKFFHLSSTSLEFNTASGCKFLPVSIINKLHSPVDFRWSIPENSNFHVAPVRGTVLPLCYIQCAVSYKLFPDQREQQSGLRLYAESGIHQNLKCSISTKKASNVSLSTVRVDMGNIPLNMLATSFTLLLNDSQQDYTFKIKKQQTFSGLTVFPQKGVLRAFSCTPIHVHCQIQKVMEFTREVKVEVQRSKVLSFTITANVCCPQITIQPPSIVLRRIPAGAHEVMPLDINNSGSTVASIEFQLDDRPEFYITQLPDPCTRKGEHVKSCLVCPEKNLRVYLHFRPLDIAAHKFILPIVINELLGPAVIGNPLTQRPSFFMKETEFNDAKVKPQPIPKEMPMVRVDITVSGRLLQFSSNVLNFNYFPDSAKNRTMEELEISNVFTQAVTFSLSLNDLEEDVSAFRINWGVNTEPTGCNGMAHFTLQPSESMSFLVFFDPNEPGHYYAKIPVYIRNYSEEKIFDVIQLEGKYPTPLLWTNAKEIFFLPVPLEVANETEMTLYALNYSEPDELRVKIQSKYKGALDISFPSGPTIPVSSKPYGIPVKIVFKSSKLRCLHTEVTFRDTSSNSCTVNVTAAADNSVLTTYSYIKCGFQFSVDDYGGVKKSITALKRIAPPYSEELSITTADTFSFTDLSDDSRLSKSNLSIRSGASASIAQTKSESAEIHTFFPMYPIADEDSENAQFLRSTMEAAECWLYQHGFSNTFAPSLPTDMTLVMSSLSSLNKSKGRKKGGITTRTIFNVVSNLGGPRVAKLFQISKYPDDEYDFVHFVWNLYRRLIDFLREQGACLAHVTPELMLRYQEYTLYMRKSQRCKSGQEPSEENQKGNIEVLDYFTFQGRSAQAWLDVILQIYKTMVLSRVVLNLEEVPYRECSKAEVDEELCEELPLPDIEVPIPPCSGEYSPAECTLLAWLNAHFEAQRTTLWKKSTERTLWNGCSDAQTLPLAPREIKNFESDLADGLVFAAVTASYCPYLVFPYLAHMFVDPSQSEQAFHNAVRVCLAWQSAGLGFSVTPHDITNPNSIKMLMLTAYLYESLPMLCPRTGLHFYAELNGETAQRITVSNAFGKRLKYGIVFIGEGQGLFSASKNCIVIPAHESAALEITFRARRIATVKATLILSGCMYPPHFGRTMTFQLVGHASSLKPVEELDVKLPIYSPENMHLEFQSPYDTGGVWDIHVSEDQPVSAETFIPVLWKNQCTRKVPRRLYLHSKDLTIGKDDKGVASLDVTIACLSPVVRTYWLVFLNATLGDFIIKLTIEPQALREPVVIPMPLPEDLECRCGQQEIPPSLEQGSFCPLVVGVPIPCRNGALWNAVLTMFKFTMDDRERNFWERYLETKIGVKLMKWLLGEEYDSVTDEIIHMFNKTVKYVVSSSDDVTIPKKFTISDVWEFGTVALPVHVSSKIKDGSTVQIILTSQDKKEVRTYSCVLVGPKSESLELAEDMMEDLLGEIE